MTETRQRILMGNEAIARGLLENGCTMAASYPGTPASEIMEAIQAMAGEESYPLHAEWSINEKVAYETALAHAYCGGRAAVSMKQVGLNVAADPFLSSAYIGVKAGFVLVSADDPGPHSSQTEQDSRLLAMLAKVPVLDPSSPRMAKDLVTEAYALSEEFELPVMIRPTTRVCHARQNIVCRPLNPVEFTPVFEKNPGRWAATPKFRLILHQQLNEKLDRIARKDLAVPRPVNTVSGKPVAVVASGVVLAHAVEALADNPDLEAKIALFEVRMPYPLNVGAARGVLAPYGTVLILEETMPVMEMQLAGLIGQDLTGRRTGFWPTAGEMGPDEVYAGLCRVTGLEPPAAPPQAGSGRRPTLCAGCPHRAAFFALKEALPGGIYPSDIGCYTLGMNMGAVDTCLCMGGGVAMAAGFDYTFRAGGGRPRPIGATIGDSTFFHSGLPPLINAVSHGASFVLLILDNGTTAMTGHQPTPALERFEPSGLGRTLSLEDVVRACGVGFLEVGDPVRDYRNFLDLLKKAATFAQSGRGPAVVISRYPCLMDRNQPRPEKRGTFQVTEDCTGCGVCQEDFGCPALVEGEGGQMKILPWLCNGCGVCVNVCPAEAIEEV
ncbi:MAG: thiamine pyrophosphate-dependent enzyme [Thermodesulfobacteriota bacterium]